MHPSHDVFSFIAVIAMYVSDNDNELKSSLQKLKRSVLDDSSQFKVLLETVMEILGNKKTVKFCCDWNIYNSYNKLSLEADWVSSFESSIAACILSICSSIKWLGHRNYVVHPATSTLVHSVCV